MIAAATACVCCSPEACHMVFQVNESVMWFKTRLQPFECPRNTGSHQSCLPTVCLSTVTTCMLSGKAALRAVNQHTRLASDLQGQPTCTNCAAQLKFGLTWRWPAVHTPRRHPRPSRRTQGMQLRGGRQPGTAHRPVGPVCDIKNKMHTSQTLTSQCSECR